MDNKDYYYMLMIIIGFSLCSSCMCILCVFQKNNFWCQFFYDRKGELRMFEIVHFLSKPYKIFDNDVFCIIDAVKINSGITRLKWHRRIVLGKEREMWNKETKWFSGICRLYKVIFRNLLKVMSNFKRLVNLILALISINVGQFRVSVFFFELPCPRVIFP